MFSGLRKLWIATDHDPAGLRASRNLGERWRDDGREALLIIPTEAGQDLIDLAIGGDLA
jgi:hypothetical protein